MIHAVWLAALLCLYAALWGGISLAGVAWRLRAWNGISGVALGTLAGVVYGLTFSGPAALLVGSLSALFVFAICHLLVIRPRLSLRDVKSGREISRQAALHLILATGSVVFLVPFAWMVVTSLKEDEDMSRFPPVWIPLQQVKVSLDGREVGLAKAEFQGRKVTVAVLRESETGERLLRILSPADLRGEEFTRHRKEIQKVKRFGPVWQNYPDALKFLPDETKHGLVFLTNTLLLSAFTVLGTLAAGSLVAFSFARLRWPGRDFLFVVLLATMMLPGAVTMMPVFLIFRALGWVDTLRPLWVPAWFGSNTSGVNSVFNIFLLRQFFLTIPYDLEDAAKIDGCSYFGIYRRIMLPLIKPALAAVTIMTFLSSWNNFMGPLIYVSSPTRMPLSYALSLFQTAHGSEPGLLMAAAVMMVLPVIVLFFFTQRYFIQGVTLTGLKG